METTDENGKAPQETLNFIPDRAADNDEFGSHEPLAQVTAHIIRARDDLKVIGLLGPWGSGKSTVVKFISDELTDSNEGDRVLCFTYDAWLHQSDPPRRSFLDALIRFLIASDLTSEDDWKDQLARLNRQIEDTDVTTTPTLSEAGKWLLPLALIVPFGMQFLGHDWFEAITSKDAGWLERLGFPLGLIFTLAPALGAAGLWLKWRENRNFLTPSFWKKPKARREKYKNESLLSVFMNREVVKQKNRTVRTPDPTTIEFQQVFREILKGVAEDKKGRPLRLIFVIDNLDRLPETQALEMWGTIRSFFLGPEAGVRAPTVILPIDEAAVKRMYAAQHSEPDIADALARSFMDKTFDLSFRVTRPVLSDWHRYVEKKLRFLFGEKYQPEWSHLVASLYDAWLINSGNKEPVTPRQLNAMLNAIGTLWLQWHHRGVKFASIAYYAMDREAIDRDILEYVTRSPSVIAPHDPNWQRAFAAMHFGVDVELASQILLDRPIRAAVTGNQVEDFARLAQSPGFAIAFNRILENELSANASSFSVARAAILFEGVSLPDSTQQSSIWWKLRRLRTRWFDGKAINAADAKSFEILFRDHDLANLSAFIRATAAALARLEDGALAQPAGRDATKRTLAAFADAAARHSTKLPPITLKLSSTPYLTLLSAVGAKAGLASILGSAASDEELRQVVVDTINNASTEPPADQMITALLLTERSWDWTPVIDAAYSRLHEGYSPSTVIAARVLGSLRQAAPHAQQRVDEVVSNGNALARFSEAYNANDNPASAALAALILVSKTPAILVTPDGLSWTKVAEGRAKFLPDVGNHIINFGVSSLSELAIIIGKASNVATLIRESAHDAISKKLLTLPTPKEIASSYDDFYLAVPAALDVVIITEAAHSEEFWDALKAAEFADTGTVLGVLIDAGNNFTERAALFAKDQLDALPVETWAAAIDEGEFPFDTAISAIKVLGDKRLGGRLAEGLQHRFEGLTKNDPKLRTRWFTLLALTSANAQKTTLRNLRDYLATHSGCEAISELLSAGDNALIKNGELEKAADGIARNLIIPMASTPADLTWMQNKGKDLEPVVKRAANETRGVIGERLETSSRSPELRDAAETLRLAWALPAFAVVKEVVEEAES